MTTLGIVLAAWAMLAIGIIIGLLLGRAICETDIDVFQSEPRCPKCPYCDCKETEFE
jgi:hypothetical protein